MCRVLRGPVKSIRELWRGCALKTSVRQDAQPELNTLWYSQPVELAKEWCNRIPHPRLEDKSRCGVKNGLQPSQETTGDTGEHGVAIVDPANH